MVNFSAQGSVTQSIDGKTLTFNDNSPYGNNNQNLLVTNMTSRTVVVTDSVGNVIGTITLLGTALIGTLPITKDGWYHFAMSFVSNEPATYSGQLNYQSTQFFALSQRNYADQISCGCGCASRSQQFANKALHAIFAANTDFNIGDGVNCQTKLDYANVAIQEAIL